MLIFSIDEIYDYLEDWRKACLIQEERQSKERLYQFFSPREKRHSVILIRVRNSDTNRYYHWEFKETEL
jgi:hypothetical protein